MQLPPEAPRSCRPPETAGPPRPSEPAHRCLPLGRVRHLGRRPLLGTALLLCLGCWSGADEPTGPLDPALTGYWLGPTGVDTWDALTLEQHGADVTGTHDMYSANFGGSATHVPLSGTADLPRVVLRWRDGSYEIIATGVLSPDSLSLTVTESIAGRNGHGMSQVYRRRPPPSS